MTDEEFARAVSKLFDLWNKNGGRKLCSSCGSSGFLVHPALLENKSDRANPAAPFTRFPSVAVY
ncbi:hypothetical protein, partial [Methylobacterium sp. WL30]|uniref:hypothetical protein n=1 Tax=Methylobacterium sp. WL30 TaxID=2603895 RepID=UPI001AEE6726